ncbi:MAG TPA: hypothetical protein VM115_02745 [Vicinamibacterales bacterium]|nr:hypothetical protein [Vicinamibacterales bacterium]
MQDSLRTTSRAGPIGPAGAAAIYFAITIIFTWPLAAGLTRDIPWDLGDSLLNAWILAWDADRLLRFLGGDIDAIRNFWNANIFYPEPLTLAYSEHLFAQAVQILPVYALTGNIILSYNLLFLSTFVLSGLGMFLFVREITGSARAGFVAGLIYAFAPYRVPQFSHLQVISSQWMPFALYGLRRYFVARRIKPLIGVGGALIAQNLSNGYFLLFFAPFVLAYALFEIATRRLWADARVWVALSATAAIVTAVTLPFLLPYLELRRLGFGPRVLNEVKAFSADVFSYWTSPIESRLWGSVIRRYPKPEGDLFPTITATCLAIVGIAGSVSAAWTDARTRPAAASNMLRPIVWVLLASATVYVVFLVVILTSNGFTHIGPFPVSVRNLWRNSRALAVILVVLLFVSPRARSFARNWIGTFAAFLVIAGAAAFLMSLGPEIRSSGRLISEVGPYHFFYNHVPGFDGLRVPARFAMLVILFLSVAAGLGAVALEQRFRRGGAIAIVLGALAVAEAFAAPIVINGTVAEGRYAMPPARVYTGEHVPGAYRFLKTLPAPGTVVVEFPLGEWAYEVRYVFYSAAHWHPILNGYSGHFPLSYNMNATHLRHPLDYPDASWDTLLRSGATHAVVHLPYYQDDEGARIAIWLQAKGAKRVGEFDGDQVFALR